MDKLKLHSEGRNEYLKQLELQFKKELEEINQNIEFSESQKQEAIQHLKSKYRELREQSGFSLF